MFCREDVIPLKINGAGLALRIVTDHILAEVILVPALIKNLNVRIIRVTPWDERLRDAVDAPVIREIRGGIVLGKSRTGCNGCGRNTAGRS